jgi:hypothetical protein
MPPAPALTRENLAYWKDRLGRVRPDSPRRFGKLDPPGMMRHLRRTLEPVVGDYTPENMDNFVTRRAVFHWLFLVMPWPKGRVVAPDWLTPPAEADLDQERASLFAVMERFADLHAQDPRRKVRNPLLGDVSLDYTSRLQGKHLNHHAVQFGV